MSDSSATLQTVARRASLSLGFPRREHWSGLPFPPPGDLGNLVEPTPPVRQADASPLSPQGSPVVCALPCSVAQPCPTLCDPRTVSRQAPLSMGFSRQADWSGSLSPAHSVIKKLIMIWNKSIICFSLKNVSSPEFLHQDSKCLPMK